MFSLLFISNFMNTASADLFKDAGVEVEVEVGVWEPSYTAMFLGNDFEVVGDEESVYASASIEHSIRKLPHVKISVSEIDADLYDYTKVDYTLYYKVIDKEKVSLDLGAGVSKFNGNELIETVFEEEAKPHLYLNAEVATPIPNTSIYTNIQYLKHDGEELNDSVAGIKYKVDLETVDIGLKAGYRVQSFKKDDAEFIVLGGIIEGELDVENDGYFIGIDADF